MSDSAVRVGSERQLFLDDFWFERMQDVSLTMHPPVAREVAFASDRPWESGGLHYSCVVKDGGRYRMWYRSDGGDAKRDADWKSYACYAESADGVHWEKPSLGLVDFGGSRDNNIVMTAEDHKKPINISVVLDQSARSPERYKMIGRMRVAQGDSICAYVSADGIEWKPVEANPVLLQKPFDTHSILVRDDARGLYVIYTRGFDRATPTDPKKGRRSIRRSESKDFRNWSEPVPIVQNDADDPANLELYTNAAVKYGRAANAYLMFPMILYPDRQFPGAINPGVSDVQFASSRDGIKWDRLFRRPFVSPGLDRRNWVDRNPIMGQGVVETGEGELSMYYSELFREGGPHTRFRRCTLRTDGFVSVEGPYTGWGEFVTRPFVFEGTRLEMNYSTSGGGSIFVELQDETGASLPGFGMDDAQVIYGDTIDGVVSWKGGADVAALAGSAVRMRVRMRDAHVYAFRFG